MHTKCIYKVSHQPLQEDTVAYIFCCHGNLYIVIFLALAQKLRSNIHVMWLGASYQRLLGTILKKSKSNF